MNGRVKNKELTAEEVISRVIEMLRVYDVEDFSEIKALEEKGDPLDPVVRKLNELTARSKLVHRSSYDYQKRVENLLQVLLRYVLFDFTEKAHVSEAGDEIDAIALGLNTLAEELQAARETEERQVALIRERSEQMEVILNNAPTAVIVIGEDDKVMSWSVKAEHIFGWKSEEAVGQSLDELIIPRRFVKSHRQGLGHYLETGEGPILNRTTEVVALHRNGHEFPAELGVSAVISGGRKFFIGFVNDISARKNAEERLRRTNQSLENSNKELESFSYSVSHDLRAPLRAINGYTQLLTKEYGQLLDDRGQQMMGSVLKNVKKMGQLIDDLLALSRFGRAELKRGLVDMNRLVNNVIFEMGRQVETAGTKIEVKPLPPAMADPVLLTQVVTNLVSNAVKYSSRNENPRVEIGAKEEAGETVYYVMDNGAGFDMKFYDKLFGVFQRLHDASEYEGTGVGLAIVKRIIDRHDGRVWAEAEPGKGATFYFTIGTNQKK
jgi:PAS domain S-box-containing protein